MKHHRHRNATPRRPRPRHQYRENEKVPTHANIVNAAGGDYVCSNAMNADLVMFNSRESGSTLCIHEKLLTVENVRKHIDASNKKFGL